MARRKGQEWFLGAMTNNEGSEEEIPLDFLDKNKVYLASVYTDGGEKVKTRTQVECSYLLVDASMTMKFDLKPSGGAAVRFVPVEAKEAKGLKNIKEKYYKGLGVILPLNVIDDGLFKEGIVMVKMFLYCLEYLHLSGCMWTVRFQSLGCRPEGWDVYESCSACRLFRSGCVCGGR